MSSSVHIANSKCAVYVDAGTTNTRVWLMRGDEVLSSASHPAGIRDAARDKSTRRTEAALRELIARVTADGESSYGRCVPQFVVACGMIGSSLGLAEVRHCSAPAGITELVNASQWKHFPSVTDLPVLIVPGVRSGPAVPTMESISEFDVMRGEEVLCTGLVLQGLIRGPASVLNLGSHWKVIGIAPDGRIHFSVTSLSGELIQALQTNTILASSVVNERPTRLHMPWIEAGMREQRTSGLSRALFAVRLLDLAKQGSAEDRLAFLAGTIIAADLDALISREVLNKGSAVAIVGPSAIAQAWKYALAKAAIPAKVIDAEDSRRALLTALRRILHECIRTRSAEHAVERAISK